MWLLTRCFFFTLKEGLTPYNYAEQNGNSEMMRLLKEEQRNAERSNKSSTCVILWPSHLRMSILLCRHLRKNCTSCVLFACRSIQMRSAHAWNVNDVISVIERTCWRSNVFLYLSVNKYTDCFSVYLTVTYYLFILTTHKSLYTYVIFLHNLFYNIVLWYTLLYNKLFISLMWFVCIINCYYVIIFFVEENPNKVMLRVIIYLYVSFLFPCRRS